MRLETCSAALPALTDVVLRCDQAKVSVTCHVPGDNFLSLPRGKGQIIGTFSIRASNKACRFISRGDASTIKRKKDEVIEETVLLNEEINLNYF